MKATTLLQRYETTGFIGYLGHRIGIMWDGQAYRIYLDNMQWEGKRISDTMTKCHILAIM